MSEILKIASKRYQDPVLWVWLEVFFTPKRYQDPVLWVWLEMFFTPKSYQFYSNTLSPVISFNLPQPCYVLRATGNLNTLLVIKINVLLFTFVCVFFESFRMDLNEAKAV